MCGRFLLSIIPEQYAGLLRIAHVPNFGPDLFGARLNIAPTQQVLIVRNTAMPGSARELTSARWGMHAPWDTAPAKRPIFNARSETAWDKPLFRDAARSRRCVIPADGFYEWQKPLESKGKKQPYLITNADQSPMFFAGLWTADGDQGDGSQASCAILTTSPNSAIEPIHNRMPVILNGQPALDRWMDPATSDRGALEDLLEPSDTESLMPVAIDSVGDNRRTKRSPDNTTGTLFD